MTEAWRCIDIGGLEGDVSAWCNECKRYVTPTHGTWRGSGFEAVVAHLRDVHGYDARLGASAASLAGTGEAPQGRPDGRAF